MLADLQRDSEVTKRERLRNEEQADYFKIWILPARFEISLTGAVQARKCSRTLFVLQYGNYSSVLEYLYMGSRVEWLQ
jgi:hypothetical protein